MTYKQLQALRELLEEIDDITEANAGDTDAVWLRGNVRSELLRTLKGIKPLVTANAGKLSDLKQISKTRRTQPNENQY